MRAWLAIPLVIACGSAHGHDGGTHVAAGPLWTLDAWVTLPLAVSGLLYARGVWRLWRRLGIGRGVRVLQAECFAAGWLLLAGALVSPLHWLGERLFTAHMVEHEILMTLAAPLLVLARPIGGMLWALPPRWRVAVGGVARRRPAARLWSRLNDPLTATILHGVALWAWHAPSLFAAALAHPLLHWLQHLSFVVSAVLFWWALIRGPLRQRGYGAAVFYLFVTALHSGFLGILLAVARLPVYPAQTSAASEFGLTAIEDQQLAGLIMWVPAGLVYLVAALALAGLWIRLAAPTARRGGDHALASP
jgi:putative membrane protein